MILEGALEDGIVDQAQTNARAFLTTFLVALGFEKVEFIDVVPTATPALTPTAAATTP